jgi:hypothetical protein
VTATKPASGLKHQKNFVVTSNLDAFAACSQAGQALQTQLRAQRGTAVRCVLQAFRAVNVELHGDMLLKLLNGVPFCFACAQMLLIKALEAAVGPCGRVNSLARDQSLCYFSGLVRC